MRSVESGAASPAGADERVPLAVPAVIACGMFMAQLDSTIVATSTPQMALSLGVSPLSLNVAITSYLITMAIFIPISGWCADRFGPRRVFCAALTVFSIGSVLCGLSTSLSMLVASRVLQGLGGAMMTPVGRLILVRSFSKERLVTAMSYISLPALVGPALGPLVGGALTTYLSWRWIFYINLPIGLAALLIASRSIRDFAIAPPPRFDLLGFVLAGAGLGTFAVAVEYLGRHVVPFGIETGLFAFALLLIGAYGVHAFRVPHPVIDPIVFRVATFRMATLAGSLSRLAIGSVPFLLPLLLQVGFGLDALHSGLLTFVTSLGAMANKTMVRRLLRWAGFRQLLLGNGILLGVMIAGLAFFRATTPHPVIWLYLFVFGFVRSVQLTSLNALGYADLTTDIMSKGTSILSVAQQLSMSLGVAIGAMLLTLEAGGTGHITAASFPPVFGMIAVLAIFGAANFFRLAPSAGNNVTGHQLRRPQRPVPAHDASSSRSS